MAVTLEAMRERLKKCPERVARLAIRAIELGEKHSEAGVAELLDPLVRNEIRTGRESNDSRED